jgi:hypothetical protein
VEFTIEKETILERKSEEGFFDRMIEVDVMGNGFYKKLFDFGLVNPSLFLVKLRRNLTLNINKLALIKAAITIL